MGAVEGSAKRESQNRDVAKLTRSRAQTLRHKQSTMSASCVPLVSYRDFARPNTILATVDGVGTATRWARSFIGCHAGLADKPAIVLDVDGTILTNYEGGVAKRVCYFTSFAKACTDFGVKIFVITGRADKARNRRWTERQLTACGIKPIAKLYMRPKKEDYGTCKYNQRQEIRRAGYKILLSVGDQWRDLCHEGCDDLSDDLSDDKTYIGTIGDDRSYAIKLPLECVR